MASIVLFLLAAFLFFLRAIDVVDPVEKGVDVVVLAFCFLALGLALLNVVIPSRWFRRGA
jgi:hypothetical protein